MSLGYISHSVRWSNSYGITAEEEFNRHAKKPRCWRSIAGTECYFYICSWIHFCEEKKEKKEKIHPQSWNFKERRYRYYRRWKYVQYRNEFWWREWTIRQCKVLILVKIKDLICTEHNLSALLQIQWSSEAREQMFLIFRRLPWLPHSLLYMPC